MAEQHFQLEVHESGLNPHKVANGEFDDDGKPSRTGRNLWTTSAHIITAIIGSGVLSLAWCVAQLGWVVGVATLLIFSLITLYTSNLLADCYRSPDPATGKRNYTYTDAVKTNLGDNVCGMWNCSICQPLWDGYWLYNHCLNKHRAIKKVKYAITIEVVKLNASFSNNPYMIGLGILEIFLSQIPELPQAFNALHCCSIHVLWLFLFIGMGTCLRKGGGQRTTMTGVEVGIDISAAEKTWRMFQAFGDIAFAFSYSQLLIEIQDTLKSSKPENKVMKKANVMALLTTTTFYMMCGCFGYAAFGDRAPGNLLTGFGFYEPFWLVDMANIFIVVHLVGAYQVFSQPVFSAVESWANMRWSKSTFVMGEYPMAIGNKFKFNANFFRLTWRTIFVILATTLAMALPFFNDILALLGAIGYWPLTVFFPVEMYIAKRRIRRWTNRWLGLQLINVVCFLVALAATCGSIQGLSKAFNANKPFQAKE
ncbi:hypothetical protein TEA_010554 [Camellia sinensis var. sinensis]|uniref:Amino acid transporter transmembrane domain-containing protein n=1 Tax=Camellia sinensis var. sinensis TaxID=542762 RepID=A0A4S4E485_CAMSN|nr:hypothetical protein TEA_010554 [Camellia sinensis var. sinensis]